MPRRSSTGWRDIGFQSDQLNRYATPMQSAFWAPIQWSAVHGGTQRNALSWDFCQTRIPVVIAFRPLPRFPVPKIASDGRRIHWRSGGREDVTDRSRSRGTGNANAVEVSAVGVILCQTNVSQEIALEVPNQFVVFSEQEILVSLNLQFLDTRQPEMRSQYAAVTVSCICGESCHGTVSGFDVVEVDCPCGRRWHVRLVLELSEQAVATPVWGP
jgi:hypothetical protein